MHTTIERQNGSQIDKVPQGTLIGFDYVDDIIDGDVEHIVGKVIVWGETNVIVEDHEGTLFVCERDQMFDVAD